MAQPRPRRGPNRRAVDGTLRALRAADRLAPEHDALVQLVRSLADAVDAHPDNASLWREYRTAVTDLADLTREDGDAFTGLVARLSAPVGDTTN